MKKNLSKRGNTYQETKKSAVIVFCAMVAVILAIMIYQIVRGSLHDVLLCLLSLVLMLLPAAMKLIFKIELPNFLEIITFLFIFAAEILGEMLNFYGRIPFWDTMLHIITGFMAAGIGFGIIILLNNNAKSLRLTPAFVALFSLCLSMTVGVVWEFVEFGIDNVLNMDMQKDRIVESVATVTLDPKQDNNVVRINGIEYTVMYGADGAELARVEGGYLDTGIIDTMKDLLVNFLGAITFAATAFFYTKHRDKRNRFAEKFIITPAKREPRDETKGAL